jgi:hypothetical protein
MAASTSPSNCRPTIHSPQMIAFCVKPELFFAHNAEALGDQNLHVKLSK